MADIRIKDLATTASSAASDDFMALDGVTNGTRKLSAAAPAFLTSVTTPSLTSPAGNNLTLGLGTGGTALTLASSTLAATFAGSITTSNGSLVLTGTPVIYFGAPSSNYLYYNGSTLATRLGGTDRMIINGTTGDVSLSSTTAGSAGAGALVVAGGISVGAGIDASSHFGGKLEITGEGSTNYGTSNPVLYLKRYTSPNGNFLLFQGRTAYSTYIGTIGTAAGIATTNDDLVIGVTGNAPTFAITASTGAATFAGAVTAGSTIKAGAGSGETLSAGSVDVAKDIGIASTQGIVQGGVRIVTFTSGAATFAGAVTAGGNLTVSGTGSNTLGGDLLVGSGAWPSTNFGRSESRMVIAGSAGGGVLGIGDTQAGVAANRGGTLYLFARGTNSTTDIAGASLVSKRANATSGNFSSSLELGVSTSATSNPVTQLTLTETAATFAGTVIAPAATASLAPLRIPHGTAPTSPTNGDMWTTTAGLFIRINGATVGPLS